MELLTILPRRITTTANLPSSAIWLKIPTTTNMDPYVPTRPWTSSTERISKTKNSTYSPPSTKRREPSRNWEKLSSIRIQRRDATCMWRTLTPRSLRKGWLRFSSASAILKVSSSSLPISHPRLMLLCATKPPTRPKSPSKSLARSPSTAANSPSAITN